MKRIILLLVTICICYACENEPLSDTEQNQELILKQINRLNLNSIEGYLGLFADFDNQGKITQVYHIHQNDTTYRRQYTYNENGLINEITTQAGQTDYTYDENNVLINIIGGSSVGYSHYDFTYNNNFMFAQNNFDPQLFPHYGQYEFEDNTFKKLISIESINPSNNNEITNRKTFHYEGNNLVEILHESINSDTQILEPTIHYLITYDDKINPFLIGLPENAYLVHSVYLLSYVGYNLAYGSDNNITSIISTDYTNNTSSTITRSYTYNDLMYPVTVVEFINDTEIHETFEYY